MQRRAEALIFHFPHYQGNEGPHSAIRLGNFKLITFYETGQLRLFDLARDIGEQHDLSGEMPEKTGELHARLKQHLEAVDAQLPVPNPDYDPNKAATASREQTDQRRKSGRRQGGGRKRRGRR